MGRTWFPESTESSKPVTFFAQQLTSTRGKMHTKHISKLIGEMMEKPTSQVKAKSCEHKPRSYNWTLTIANGFNVVFSVTYGVLTTFS